MASKGTQCPQAALLPEAPINSKHPEKPPGVASKGTQCPQAALLPTVTIDSKHPERSQGVEIKGAQPPQGLESKGTQCPHAVGQPLGVVRLTPSQLARAYGEGMQNVASEDPTRRKSSEKADFIGINEHSEKLFNKAEASVAVLPQPELGNLTHALLADVSLQLPSCEHPFAEEDLKIWLRAALANQGKHEQDPLASQAFALACATLLGPVGEMIRQADWVSFEHPVTYLIKRGILIEGKADLVLQGPWGIAVIDFKSSQSAVTSPATFVQLCGYARAFVVAEQNPVWAAAARLGSSQPLVRRVYDEQAETTLQQAVDLAFAEIQARIILKEAKVQ